MKYISVPLHNQVKKLSKENLELVAKFVFYPWVQRAEHSSTHHSRRSHYNICKVVVAATAITTAMVVVVAKAKQQLAAGGHGLQALCLSNWPETGKKQKLSLAFWAASYEDNWLLMHEMGEGVRGYQYWHILSAGHLGEQSLCPCVTVSLCPCVPTTYNM